MSHRARAVTPAGLARFLGPSEYHKSVTVVFTPVPAHEAAREVDRQAQAALFGGSTAAARPR